MKSMINLLLAMMLVTATNYSRATNLTTDEQRTEDRHLSGFHAIDVAGSFDVYIEQGNTESVKVEAPDEVIDRILTEVNGGVLKIYNKSNFNWNGWSGNHKKTAIYVTVKELNNIALTGSGDVFFKDGISANTLKLSLVGSGDLSGKIEVKTLECRLAGSGDIKVVGQAENASVSVIGSGNFSAKGLLTVNTSVKVAGSGDATVNVSNSINASVSGSGDVRYTGSAKQVSTSKAGSGDISKF